MKMILNDTCTAEITHISIHYEPDSQDININLDYEAADYLKVVQDIVALQTVNHVLVYNNANELTYDIAAEYRVESLIDRIDDEDRRASQLRLIKK